jgi:hypothetical protein
MDFESVRPVLSGVAGGIIATWLTSRWSRRLPPRHNGRSRDALVRQHRPAIWTANALFFIGLVFGVGLYRMGGFDSADWRPVGLGFGLASIFALLAIFAVSIFSGRDPREAYVAFSFGQGMPLWATYGVLGAGSVAFVFAVASLYT